jgi:Big-like domain-containing protein
MTAALLLTTFTGAVHGQTRGGFDSAGRLLMHGTPRFTLGVYDSGGSYSTDPAIWEQQIFSPAGPRGLQGFGLNVYLNYWLGGMPIGPTNALLDVLHNHGMMYLQTGNCFEAGSWTRYGPGSFSIMSQTYVQQFAQHPAALGYYIMDECDDALIPETETHQQQLKTWDPQGITFAATLAAAYRDPSLWKNAVDVLGVDPYPLYGPEPATGYTHFVVADFISKLRAVAKPDRPVWSVHQFFKFTSDSRVPTAEELRAHAVMAIVEGAQGIFWWDIGTNGLRSGSDAATVSTAMSNLKALTVELAGLEPALVADAAPGALVGNSTKFADPVAGRIAQLQHNVAVEWLYSRIEWYRAEIAALQAGDTSKSGGMLNGAASVRTLTKLVNGVGYVFAYNYTNVPQPATLTWHSAPTSVTESKTGQAFALNGASWSDTLAPYQARIYVVNGAGSAPPPPPPSALTLSFTNPASGATVSGTATVTMAAAGGGGYTFAAQLDGTAAYSGTNPSFSWNTTATANGTHTLTATVTDAQNRTATATLPVMVSNTTAPPPPPPPPPTAFTVSFSYPASGATVNGNQSVGLSTTAAWGQAKTIALSVDGTVLTSQSVTGTTLWYTWDTTATANGSRTLTATVTMNGQTATATLPVTVSNAGATPPPPPPPPPTPPPPPPTTFTASITYPGAGATVSGNQSVGMSTTAAWGQSKTFTLSVDGKAVTTQTLTGTTLWYTWNTKNVGDGARTLTLSVTMNGQTATTTLQVTVKNKKASTR